MSKDIEKKLLPIPEDEDPNDSGSGNLEEEFDEDLTDETELTAEAEVQHHENAEIYANINKFGDMNSEWMKAVPCKSFKRIYSEKPDKCLKSDIEQSESSSAQFTEKSSISNITSQENPAGISVTQPSDMYISISRSEDMEAKIDKPTGTNLKVVPVYVDKIKQHKKQRKKRDYLQEYITNLNKRVNQVPEKYFPYIETVEDGSKLRTPKFYTDKPSRQPIVVHGLTEEQRQKRLKRYKVDSIAVGQINQSLYEVNPRFHILPKPYNSLNDKVLKKHFEIPSIKRLLRRTGLIKTSDSGLRGEVLGKRQEEQHFQMGKYNDYLYRRNRHGLGRADENNLGHEDFVEKYGRATLIGWYGEEGYKNNTPFLRKKPCIGLKILPVLNDSKCVITASVYNSHPGVTRNWIRNDYVGEFIRETKNRLPPKVEI